MARIEINELRCKGCGLCMVTCPKGLIQMSKHINSQGFTPAVVERLEQCTGCTFCAEICPDVAIDVFR